MSVVSVLSGLVTRTWRVGPSLVPVVLTHNTIVGDRYLTVDGVEVPGSQGTFLPFSDPIQISFEVPGVGKGVIHISAVSFKEIMYRCTFNDETIKDDSAALHNLAMDSSVGKLRVTVEGYDFAFSDGKPTAFYRVATLRDSDRAHTVVHRRFNGFVSLDEAVRSAYRGTPLLSSLPDLPSRGFSFLQNGSDPAFLQKRQWQLQAYLHALESVPQIRNNTDFASFIGLVDHTAEYSHVFDGPTLGLTLTRPEGQEFIEVSDIKSNPDGTESAAQKSKFLRIGDKLSKVSGEDVIGQSYEVVIAMIKSTPKPIVLHFLSNARLADLPDKSEEKPVAVNVAPAPAGVDAPAVPVATSEIDFFSSS